MHLHCPPNTSPHSLSIFPRNLFPMADSQHSSSNEFRNQTPSNDTLADSQEETSEESKLEFSEDEETLIIRMYNLVGKRWPLIAGRIPGRTAEEIEKYWTSRYILNK
ncbi:MYB-like transcription factor ETC3 [Corylus avellana]|uniref:MYB-like transcription factor ETC3 n=1 Tax=Corylus avellana TaxID=13451 RepID=UPI00286C9B93|nr:MYB-like transcription factor ETC3 [Corylus avellana]